MTCLARAQNKKQQQDVTLLHVRKLLRASRYNAQVRNYCFVVL